MHVVESLYTFYSLRTIRNSGKISEDKACDRREMKWRVGGARAEEKNIVGKSNRKYGESSSKVSQQNEREKEAICSTFAYQPVNGCNFNCCQRQYYVYARL